MVDLEEWVRTRAQRVKNPSKRKPDEETDSNTADIIERQLQQDGHKVWGWVIYRCTYKSDKDWQDFMQRFHYFIRDILESHNGLDMLESLDCHVFEDKSFEGASPATIRQHFKQWAETAPEREQDGVPAMQSQRYNFCIHVDEDAVQSIISNPPPHEDIHRNGYVNLVILKMWGGIRAEFQTDNTENLSYPYDGKKCKTYSSRDSHVVTHRSTNLPFNCLCMAERTGCPVFS
ncbi:hypothetical protein KCU61_g8808, partial [Aureobasidium melanogenum]